MDNRQHFLKQLHSNWVTQKKIYDWLSAGVRAVVLDGTHPSTAFDMAAFVFVGGTDDWESDLSEIYSELDEKKKSWFRSSLIDCITFIEDEDHANDPGRMEGKNPENLALTYLSIARRLVINDVLKLLRGLIQVKFPKSQAVFDHSVLTWRSLATGDPTTDWSEVFAPLSAAGIVNEPRWWPEYSPAVAFGMCVAQPHRTNEFLFQWPPLQEYFLQLDQVRTEEIGTKAAIDAKSKIEAYSSIYERLVPIEQWSMKSAATNVILSATKVARPNATTSDLRLCSLNSNKRRLSPHPEVRLQAVAA